MFTKGLSRRAVVLSKFTSSAVIMTVSYWLSFAVAWAYTAYLWPGEGFKHLLLSAFVVWLTALLYLCILMLGCVMFRQAFTAILFLLVFTVVMGLLSMTPLLEGVSPSFLVVKNVDHRRSSSFPVYTSWDSYRNSVGGTPAPVCYGV